MNSKINPYKHAPRNAQFLFCNASSIISESGKRIKKLNKRQAIKYVKKLSEQTGEKYWLHYRNKSKSVWHVLRFIGFYELQKMSPNYKTMEDARTALKSSGVYHSTELNVSSFLTQRFIEYVWKYDLFVNYFNYGKFCESSEEIKEEIKDIKRFQD